METTTRESKKIRGWLLTAILLSVLQGGSVLVDLIAKTYAVVDIPFVLFFAAGHLAAATLLWFRRPHAVRVMRYVLKIELAAYGALTLLGATAFYVNFLNDFRDLGPVLYTQEQAGVALFIWVWVFYFKKSKRVRETYPDEFPASTQAADPYADRPMWILGALLAASFLIMTVFEVLYGL